jgi:hypothetical protein
MRTTARDDAHHSPGDHWGGCGCGTRRYEEDTPAARRRALEEHQRDLEQKLADVADQLRDLPPDQPEASE